MNRSYPGFESVGMTSEDTNLRELENNRLAMMNVLGLAVQNHVTSDQTGILAETGNTGYDCGDGGGQTGISELHDLQKNGPREEENNRGHQVRRPCRPAPPAVPAPARERRAARRPRPRNNLH